MKHIYWIVFLILFVLYNALFNKEQKSGGMYYFDLMVMVRFFVSALIYLASWIVWFIIFK